MNLSRIKNSGLRRWAMAWAVMLSLVAVSEHIKYFAGAAYGQLSMMAAARPIKSYLVDPSVDAATKEKLRLVQRIRQFAIQELGLPDNGSYTTYVDVKRPYVVWNVIATPPLSIRPVEWCFPIAGCVTYRGYYNREDALDYARSLKQKGYDVHVSGVPAYSTLGWFKDPVISTFINYSEIQLARLIFHELAHQILYVEGDTQFNEAFAVAVEEEGVARWIARHGDEMVQAKYLSNQGRKKDFLGLLGKYQAMLADTYASPTMTDQEKRGRKAEIFQALKDEFVTIKTAWGGYPGYDDWFAQSLGNAHLASLATYHQLVPGFRALLRNQPDLSQFFVTVKSLAALPKQLRDQQLAGLGEQQARTTPVNQHEHPGPARSVPAVTSG